MSMREFKSFIASDMQAFVAFKRAAERWNETYDIQLSLFDKYCSREYPNGIELTQEMVEGWCRKRDTESNNSCISRINPVISFIQYLNRRSLTKVSAPVRPNRETVTYIPHAFSEDELRKFFKACDEIQATPASSAKQLRKHILPVFFRLLYSSGMRTKEARCLRPDDVDLKHGVINIRYSKGHSQHFVVLHDSTLDLMRRYNTAMEKLCPNRTVFFPDRHGAVHDERWINSNFRSLWDKYNDSHAVAYDFRHNYAIENINSWIGKGFGFDAKLLYLSKSMGHYSTENTKYYYSLVPALADLINDMPDADAIIPEVNYAGHR